MSQKVSRRSLVSHTAQFAALNVPVPVSPLFVDDEARILPALQRALRSLRREWEMVFAEGGPAALEQCAATLFDVVVSDARMPGMEGSILLDSVLERYPDTVRIILSGQCSRTSVLNCVAVAHQFLSKPCNPAHLGVAIRKALDHKALLRENGQLPNSTVLCVDDDPNVSEALARGLYRHGIRVLRVFLGIQGLSQAITERPDVIILDLAMPKGQGTEILECLKRNRQTAHIPVLILTGNQDSAMKGRVKRLGAAGYFNKPIVFDALLDEICRYIPRPVSADAADCR